MQQRSELPLYLTREVIYKMNEYDDDQIIYLADDEGGVVVGMAAHIGDEGTGVWIDAGGIERFEGGKFETSEAATAGYAKLDAIPNLFAEQAANQEEQEDLKLLTKEQRKYMKKKGKKIQRKALKKLKKRETPDRLKEALAIKETIPLPEVEAALAESNIPPDAQDAIMQELEAQQPVSKLKRKGKKK